MYWNGFLLQLFLGTLTTIKLALCATLLGLSVGLLGALLESIPFIWIRYPLISFIFIIRSLPELLVLFFIYFGVTAILSQLFTHYVDINPFIAGTIALGCIFGAYASQVFRGAFLAIDPGQIDAGAAIGFTPSQIFVRIKLPQAWRHALPGLSNLWLVLLKDTSIVSLIGLTDLMGQAKIAASTTHEAFTFYLTAAGIYLFITSLSQKILNFFTIRANRHIHL